MTRLSEPVTLSRPVRRDDGDVTEVRLAEPMAGQLRGLKQSDLVQMDVGAMLTLLPRITRPHLNEPECDALTPRDLLKLSQEVVLFFVTSAEIEALSETASGSPTP